jgi:carbonyl reductase 1
VRQLALQYPKSDFNNGGSPLVIYLTARDQSRGQEAVQTLAADPLLVKAKALKAEGGLAEIKFHQLDIADDKSINDFASFLSKEHSDGIDIGK